MVTRLVEMYSLVEWDTQLRTMFCLGYDPYYFGTNVEGGAAKRARELLESLGVFYYRDMENGQGIMLRPTNGNRFEEFTGNEVIFNTPCPCYFFTANMAYPSMRPVDYIPPDNFTKAENFLKYKEKWGDTKQWTEWNKPKLITHITNKVVRTIKKEM